MAKFEKIVEKNAFKCDLKSMEKLLANKLFNRI